jgi:hypothetical protein
MYHGKKSAPKKKAKMIGDEQKRHCLNAMHACIGEQKTLLERMTDKNKNGRIRRARQTSKK